MKTKIFFFAAFAALLFFVSCKKESTKPQLTFTAFYHFHKKTTGQ